MITAKRFLLGLCLLSLVALTLTGCGSGSDTIPVTGTVTLDGKPLEGASVNFSPAEAGTPARAVTDASGKFELTTNEPKDGALPGSYNVGVTKMDKDSVDSTAAPDGSAEEGMMLSGPGAGRVAPRPKSLIPDKYTNPNKSGITVEVKEGMEPVTIELTSD